jgi:AraC-like DNA-binding protein
MGVSMSSAGLFLDHYSTSALAPEERHEAWVHRDWPSFAPVFRTTPLEPFDVQSATLRLGEVTVQYTRITGQRWTRDSAMMRSYDPDALGVAITLSGQARGDNASGAFRTEAGSVHFGDLSQPSDHVSSASRTLVVGVPRRTAEQHGLNVRALNGAILNSGPAVLVAPFLLGVRRAAATLAAEDGPRLGRIVLDMLALAASARDRAERVDAGGRRTVLAIAARREIEGQLGSPSLNVANLCRRLGLSRSSLHRLFEAEGGVQAYIRERRLEAARLALADAGSREPIYVIAERLGFSDAAHLSRLFRERFGQSPSDFRMEARAARSP